MILFTLDSTLCWQITLTLFHVSWLGALIGLMAAIASRAFSQKSAAGRYLIHLAALMTLASSLPITFVVIRGLAEDKSPQAASTMPLTSVPDTTSVKSSTPSLSLESSARATAVVSQTDSFLADALAPAKLSAPDRPIRQKIRELAKSVAPYIAVTYALGVLLMLTKLAIGVGATRRLRSSSVPISDVNLLARMAEQARKLALRVQPVIATCERVAVPIVVGLLRPMLLIPTAMISGLTSEQLEAVLTHELAHLRRGDHIVIVAQRVLEAILFFHPVTWYLSRQIHHERECSCDDLVVSLGRDRLQYAQSLLRVAELRQEAISRRNHLALAADGQRPSKLRTRIARVLADSQEDSIRVSCTWLVAGLLVVLVTCFWTLASPSNSSFASSQEEITPDHAAILTLIEQAYGGGDSVKTAHVTFRIAKPGGKLKKGLTPEICRQLLAQADLVQHPNSLRSLLGSLVEKDDLLNDTPWTTIDLYRDTRRARTTTWSANQGPDHWVSDPPWSLKWDSANSQMDLMRSTDDHEHHETLQKLFYPTAMTWTSIRSRLPDCEIRKDGESIVLDHWSRESHRRFTLDSTTGCVMSEASYINNLLEQENLQFGWKKLSEGFWLPSVIAHLIYSPEGLAECEFIIFDHTTVNTRLPEGVFELGAPPGSVIVDSRSGLKQVYSINRDVFDVTSDEQLKAAQTPLDE